jgi:hypothetical protein
MSTRKETVRICDHCKNETRFKLDEVYYDGHPLIGWLQLSEHGGVVASDTNTKTLDYDFCSKKCLELFVKMNYSLDQKLSDDEENCIKDVITRIMETAEAIQKLPWGWDGDCGANELASSIEDQCKQFLALKEQPVIAAIYSRPALPVLESKSIENHIIESPMECKSVEIPVKKNFVHTNPSDGKPIVKKITGKIQRVF